MPSDRSNGWEEVASEFIESSWLSTVGVTTIEAWARTLPRAASILNLGCGPGSPRDAVLVNSDFTVYAVDSSPSLVRSFSNRFPGAKVICEPVEESTFFGRTFDAVFSWGLLFLLLPETQRLVIRRVPDALKTGGRFLFTAPKQVCMWNDLSTGRLSYSLGAKEYRSLLTEAGMKLIGEYTDEGENHYYDAARI